MPPTTTQAPSPTPSTPPPPPSDGLTTHHVRHVYERLLGRTPAETEVLVQQQACRDLVDLLDIVTSSEEYQRQRTAPRSEPTAPTLVNAWHPDLAGYAHQPGARSLDGTTMMGREGFLFLVAGSNAVLDQHLGTTELADDWLPSWRRLLGKRRARSQALRAEFLGLVVPDKLSLLPELFPQVLPPLVPPAQRLREDPDVRVLYPVEELRGAATCLRTDTHLTLAGNVRLAESVVSRLTEHRWPTTCLDDQVEFVMSGDLGSKMAPSVVEVASVVRGLGQAELVADNHVEMSAAGAHVGTRRVLRNETSPDSRRVVVFGDSYAFPAPHYQGLAWFLAQVFREVHFLWTPFGWDQAYLDHATPDVVVCETAERFVVRPPALDSDVAELARRALA